MCFADSVSFIEDVDQYRFGPHAGQQLSGLPLLTTSQSTSAWGGIAQFLQVKLDRASTTSTPIHSKPSSRLGLSA